MRKARNLVGPYILLFQWMQREALQKVVLPEAHILQAEYVGFVIGLHAVSMNHERVLVRGQVAYLK